MPSDESGLPTVAGLVERAAATLEAAGFQHDASRTDAEVLARHLLGWDRAEWLVRLRDPAPPELFDALEAAIARRRLREPVAYITGLREFYGRLFHVTPDVLVPRPESEALVAETLEAVAERLRLGRPRPVRVADVGTGSGCLAITIVLECADVEVTATDVSPSALRVAALNAEQLGADSRVHFRAAALVGEGLGTYDIVMSNPPYVAEREKATLMPDVRDYEPGVALFGGRDGLDVIRGLVDSAERAVAPGGWLIFEIGSDQASAVSALLDARPRLKLVRVVPDLAGHARIVVVRQTDASTDRPARASV